MYESCCPSAGGRQYEGASVAHYSEVTDQILRFDPDTGDWAQVGRMLVPRAGHAVTSLSVEAAQQIEDKFCVEGESTQ